MKTITGILSASLLVLALCACTKEAADVVSPVTGAPAADSPATGRVTLSLSTGNEGSKAGSYLDNKTWETVINKFQIFVFRASGWNDDSGEILLYKVVSNPQPSSGVYTVSLDVTAGPVLVFVAANSTTSSSKSHAEVKTVAEAKQMYNSGNYWVDMTGTTSKGFAMTGSATGTVVSADICNLSVSLAKPVGRVVLGTVTNSSGATVTPKAAFISNNSWTNYYLYNLEPLNGIMSYVDCEGRVTSNRSVRITCEGGSDVYKVESGRTLTQTAISTGSAKTYNECYYSLRNMITTYSPGYHTDYGTYAAGQCPKLVILAGYTLLGKTVDYYYCIPLTKGIDRGTSYTVNVTITGPGTDDPNIPADKAAVSSSVSLSPWGTGRTVTGELGI